MPTRLRWLAVFSASCFHAAEAVAAGRAIADPRFAEPLVEPVAALSRWLAEHGLAAGRFWEHVVPLSAGIESNRQLAEVTAAKLVGKDPRSEKLAAGLRDHLAALERTVAAAVPDLVEELVLRAGPLREAWEAQGPGLLHQIELIAGQKLLPEQADVILVPPVLGGAGKAHVPYNSVRIEGMLHHAWPRLPETVRLAWMLAQLNLDLPAYSETLRTDRLARVAELAMLPVAIAAAQHVELARDEPQTLHLALSAWHLAAPSGVDLFDIVSAWWETFQAERPRWSLALAALDRMLAEAES
jgi:hypothetical protein